MTDKPTITQADRDAAIVKTAYAIALSHSNYGDGEGNKRAFAIAADLKKKLPPTNIVSAAVAELQAEVERLRDAINNLEDSLIAGAVWTVSIADTYADTLSARQTKHLYEASAVMRKVAALAQKEPVE